MESLPTLSDATAGGIEPGSITFSLCRDYVDDFIILNEDEIASAIRHVYNEEKMTIEGGAALSVAAIRKNRDMFRGKRVVAIISGRKIDESILKMVLGMGW
jgi:threonine dehydratase